MDLLLRKGVLPTSPKHVHRCGAQCPVAPPSKLSILRVSQSHMRLKVTKGTSDRAVRIDGSARVRGSTLGIVGRNRRYKRDGELGCVQVYAGIRQNSK
jgi:hypothetical protein